MVKISLKPSNKISLKVNVKNSGQDSVWYVVKSIFNLDYFT